MMTDNKTISIAHLSDLHLCPLEGIKVHELLNKRIMGYLSWRLHRQWEHPEKVRVALLQDLQVTKPDHIAVTGDLTHLGLPGQCRAAYHFLQALGPPSRVTAIPGNHDAYVAAPWELTFALWTQYMVSDSHRPAVDTESQPGYIFPSLRVRGNAAVIGVSTAQPSAPTLASGSVGQPQLQALEKILQDTGRRHLFRIILIHHPPVPGLVKRRKRLTDAAAFCSVVKRCGAELVLHGHIHRSSFKQINTARGNIPVISIPSALALGRKPERRAKYHIYHLNPAVQGWDVRLSVHGYSVEENRFIQEGEPQTIPIPQPD